MLSANESVIHRGTCYLPMNHVYKYKKEIVFGINVSDFNIVCLCFYLQH